MIDHHLHIAPRDCSHLLPSRLASVRPSHITDFPPSLTDRHRLHPAQPRSPWIRLDPCPQAPTQAPRTIIILHRQCVSPCPLRPAAPPTVPNTTRSPHPYQTLTRHAEESVLPASHSRPLPSAKLPRYLPSRPAGLSATPERASERTNKRAHRRKLTISPNSLLLPALTDEPRRQTPSDLTLRSAPCLLVHCLPSTVSP